MSETKPTVTPTPVEPTSDYDGTKPWYTSKTIWGGIVALMSLLLTFTGQMGLTPTAQSGLIEILTLLGSSGALVAIWGRIVAVKPIS